MFIKFIWQQIKTLGMVIIGGIIHPFILYPRRREIWQMRLLPKDDRKWYWKFSDTSETGFGDDNIDDYNYLNSTYGLYELVKKRNEDGMWVGDYERFATFSKLRKWWTSYRWMVFRNGAWNYIISILPPTLVGDNYNCIINTGGYACTLFRNQRYYGEQYLTYPKIEPTHFRYSITKKASWYNLHRLGAFIFSFGKWYTHFNFMVGSADFRYLIKARSFNPAEALGKANIRDEYLIKGNKHPEDNYIMKNIKNYDEMDKK